MDYVKAMLGEHARHVPAWLYVQDQGSGVVAFTGASSVQNGGLHPLRYGSERTHQFIVGEIVVRPHFVVATDMLRGAGINGLLMGHHDITHMLSDGETLLDRRPSGV